MRTSDNRKPSRHIGIILLRRVAEREWIFEFPRITEQVDDELEVAIDWMQANPTIARRMFRSLIRRYPEHVDAHHHLALAYFRDGKARKAAEAKELAEKARKEVAAVAARIAQEETNKNAAAAKEARRKAL